MGWDIVAIGTNHTLPIDNPLETAKRLTPILNGVISIGYCIDWIYDSVHKTISYASEYDRHEIKKLNINPNGCRYNFDLVNENAKKIYSQIPNIDDVSFRGEYAKDGFMKEVFETPFRIYEIESTEMPFFSFDILKENVEFDVSFPGRWFNFERVFKQPDKDENKQNLDKFRQSIFTQLKVSGCDKAYYFPDQGFGEIIYDCIDRKSDDWVSYLNSREYIENDCEDFVILNMNDYIEGRIVLSQNQNLICLIDDFSDFNV